MDYFNIQYIKSNKYIFLLFEPLKLNVFFFLYI